MSTTRKVSKKLESMLTGEKIDPVAVEYVKEGSERVLRVFLEDKEGSIDLEDCARISRQLSDWLDEENFISESYVLEVSSPGVERPLRSEDDFERFSGEKVFIKTYAPVKGRKEFTGILQGIDDDMVKIILQEEESDLELPLNSIAAARLHADFQVE